MFLKRNSKSPDSSESVCCLVFPLTFSSYRLVGRGYSPCGFRPDHFLLARYLVLPLVLVELLVEERDPLHLDRSEVPEVVLRQPDDTPADHRLNALLTHKRGLVLGASNLNDVNFPGVGVVELVEVTHQHDRRFLTALQGLDVLLTGVAQRVGRTASGVDDTEDPASALLLELDVPLDVAEVVEVEASDRRPTVNDDLPDVDVFALNIPTFVVVTTDEVRRDPVTLGILLDEVPHLVFDATNVDVVAIEGCFSVNHIPAVIDVRHPVGRKAVIEGIQNVQTLVLRSEVGVGHRTDWNLGLDVLPPVNHDRLGCSFDGVRHLQGIVHHVNQHPLRLQLVDVSHHFLRRHIEHIGELDDRHRLLPLPGQGREDLVGIYFSHFTLLV